MNKGYTIIADLEFGSLGNGKLCTNGCNFIGCWVSHQWDANIVGRIVQTRHNGTKKLFLFMQPLGKGPWLTFAVDCNNLRRNRGNLGIVYARHRLKPIISPSSQFGGHVFHVH
jgi:hypothetical protein